MSIGGIKSLEDITFVPTKDIPFSKIRFDERNPNVLSNEKNNALYHTVEKYGFAVDPWLNDTGDGYYLVIDGEHRIKMLIEKGIKSVRCKIFKVSYVDVQILRQVANKLRGEHDKTKDADEFKSIFDNKKLDEFAKMLGEPIESFQSILEKKFDMSFGNEEAEIPEPPIIPKSKLGQIYELGNHRIICGDATKKETFEKLFGKTKPNLTFDDPPYNINFNYKSYKDKISNEEYLEFCKSWYNNIKEYCKKIIITPGPRNIGMWYKIDSNITDIGTWREPNSSSGASVFNLRQCEPILFYGKYSKKRVYDYFEHSAAFTKELKDAQNVHDLIKNNNHAPAKPLHFMVDVIKSFSNKQEIICDNFLGNGTTLIACEQTDRICYGIELDPIYLDVIIERWENYTGKKAKLLKNT